MFLVHIGAGIGHAVSLPALILVGLIIGIVAGMFGVGGGFLLTPLLIYAFGVPPAMAVGSALSQKCGTSIASFIKYRKLRRGEPRIDLIMLGGSLIGVDAGTRLLAALNNMEHVRIHGHYIPVINLVLDILFIVILGYTSFFVIGESKTALKQQVFRGDVTIPGPLVTKVRIPPYIDLPAVGLTQISVPLLAYLGFVLGLASGIMGIGGGVLFMPILLYGFGLSARNAAGTGILLLFATVVVGTIEQALRGFVSLNLSMAILIGSSIGSQIGAVIAHRLPNRYLRMIFGYLVLATTLFIIWDLYKTLKYG